MARVSDSIDAQRQLIANAAHQLRTPISGLRLQAQLALKKEPPSAVRTHVREIDESAARAGHLIEQMLTLSRAEARELVETDERIDLTEIAHSVIGRYLTRALESNIDLGYEGAAGSMCITGNAVLLSELLANLVDNAIRYGRPGGRVTVSVRDESDAVVLGVADDGPGIAADDHEKIFQRFYRADSSASQGAGLGLAIVKEIADRHEATVSLETTRESGCRFSVHFHRATSAVRRASQHVERAPDEKSSGSEQTASSEVSR